jgi:adenine-specific DNA-methyltransferase
MPNWCENTVTIIGSKEMLDDFEEHKLRFNHYVPRPIEEEKNWYEWGAPRNITTINKNLGKDCIYIYNLTRKSNVAFLGKVQYFGGGLIILIPKKNCCLKSNLHNIMSYINSSTFKNNFMFSGRFKIGHRQICNSYIPGVCL